MVLNGDSHLHQQCSKDQVGYVGKGEGKMYEDIDNSWTQIPKRGSKRGYMNRSSHRVDEGASRHRGTRWEQVREHGPG